MKLLGIDTATEGCSAALQIDGEVHARWAESERGHAERILQMGLLQMRDGLARVALLH